MKYYRDESLSPKWFVWSGEKRCPKKGEYYLSGAIPHAYLAYNDLDTVYHIATEVPPPRQTIEIDGLVYRLQMPE